MRVLKPICEDIGLIIGSTKSTGSPLGFALRLYWMHETARRKIACLRGRLRLPDSSSSKTVSRLPRYQRPRFRHVAVFEPPLVFEYGGGR